MKRAAIYLRVSTVDQHPETQLLDLRQMAAQRGFEIVHEYTDRISGTKATRPGLDDLMRDARRGRFDVVLVWASDRIARSVKHFLEVLDALNASGGPFDAKSYGVVHCGQSPRIPCSTSCPSPSGPSADGRTGHRIEGWGSLTFQNATVHGND
jgi:hypothetical protein